VPAPSPAPTTPPAPGTQPPATPDASATQAPSTDAFSQAPPGGGEAAASALPNMVGDLPFYGLGPRSVNPVVTTVTTVNTTVVPGLTLAQINQQFNLSPPFPTPGFAGPYFDTVTKQRFTTAQLLALTQSTTTTNRVQTTVSTFPQPTLANRVPVTGYGAFKISDNESVRPTDRVFASYNYFDVDGLHGNSSSVHREVVGFEKTFFDGRASFEMRAPYTETGESLGGASDFGALSLILKYAAYDNRDTGDVISAGLVVTAPTGPDIPVALGSNINPTLLQPYVGYAFNVGRVYLHGFSEVILPTDSTLPSFIANDVGVGYRLESLPVIPTFEVHVNNGLNHQGSLGTPLGFADSVILTGGVHTLFGRSDLTLAVATPVAGPRLYSVEAIAQFNWRY
jgi:hypothetical protein